MALKRGSCCYDLITTYVTVHVMCTGMLSCCVSVFLIVLMMYVTVHVHWNVISPNFFAVSVCFLLIWWHILQSMPCVLVCYPAYVISLCQMMWPLLIQSMPCELVFFLSNILLCQRVSCSINDMQYSPCPVYWNVIFHVLSYCFMSYDPC